MKQQTKGKILIIEDELVLAANLKEVLEELGHEVVGIATSLTKAEEFFLQEKPNLILADIHLGDLAPVDGIQIVQRLMKLRSVPIIFTTAHDDENYRQRTRFLFPAAYLIKPLRRQQLDVSIEFALYNSFGQDGLGMKITSRPPGDEAYYVKSGQRYMRVWRSEMCYLTADGNNCWLYTTGRKHYLPLSLGSFLSEFGGRELVRVHRSHVVNRNCVQAYDGTSLYVLRGYAVDSVPYSSGYKEEIDRIFRIIKPSS